MQRMRLTSFIWDKKHRGQWPTAAEPSTASSLVISASGWPSKRKPRFHLWDHPRDSYTKKVNNKKRVSVVFLFSDFQKLHSCQTSFAQMWHAYSMQDFRIRGWLHQRRAACTCILPRTNSVRLSGSLEVSQWQGASSAFTSSAIPKTFRTHALLRARSS